MKRPWSRSPAVLISAAVIFLGGVALLFVFVERWRAEEPNWSLIEEGLYQGGLASEPLPQSQAEFFRRTTGPVGEPKRNNGAHPYFNRWASETQPTLRNVCSAGASWRPPYRTIASN